MQIVLARVEMTGIEVAGKYLYGYYTEPKIKRVPEAKALMWLEEGGMIDFENALKFARKEGYTAYRFSLEEKDPLGKAKEMILNWYINVARAHNERVES